MDALKKEISALPTDRPISTLYIGGGTPTVLKADQLSGLIKHIFEHFDFEKDYEATIEANPGTVDIDKLKTIRSSGMNRISIGIQSFSSDELTFLGRIHTGHEAEDAVRLARDTGIENISVDLIYGIPGQDMESWKKTLEKAISLKPNHISAYELTVEEGTELHRLSLPPLDEELIIGMYEHAIDYLSSKGYIHYEISNFGLPDSFSRHNLNYWDRGDYLAAGTGAHSFTNNKRSYNTADLDLYLKLISDNKSPIEHSEVITPEKAVSEAIFLGLRKTEGINLEAFSKRYSKNILTVYEDEIKEMQTAGLIETSCSECSYETDIRLTRKGLILSNEVFVRFI